MPCQTLSTTLDAGQRVIPAVGAPRSTPELGGIDPASLAYAVRVLAAERRADDQDEDEGDQWDGRFVFEEIPLGPGALL